MGDIKMRELLEDIRDTLQYIVDSEEWETLQSGSSAKYDIESIDNKLKELALWNSSQTYKKHNGISMT